MVSKLLRLPSYKRERGSKAGSESTFYAQKLHSDPGFSSTFSQGCFPDYSLPRKWNDTTSQCSTSLGAKVILAIVCAAFALNAP